MGKILLFVAMCLVTATAGFKMGVCDKCTQGGNVYLDVEHSLIDCSSSILYQKGFLCLNINNTVHWLYLTGYTSVENCYLGRKTRMANFNGDVELLLNEVIVQLHALSEIIPGVQRMRRLHSRKNVTQMAVLSTPSGMLKLNRIMELNNQMRSLSTNVPVSEVMNSAAVLLNPLALPITTFEEKVERFFNSIGEHSTTTTSSPLKNNTTPTQHNVHNTTQWNLSSSSSEEM